MIRVLQVTGAYPPMRCGVGDYTAHLVGALAEMPGIDIGVLTSTGAAESPHRCDAFFPVMEHWGLAALPSFLTILDEFRPDIVHLQYPASFGRVFLPNFLPLICKFRGIHVVQTWHEHPIYSQVINAAALDALVVIDPDYPDAYRQPYRALVRKTPCFHIPIGANIPKALVLPHRQLRIREMCNALDKRLIAYFGFAGNGKGLELLFQVADPRIDRIVLICDLNPSDVYQSNIIQLAESESWKGSCLITGYLPDIEVAEVLDSADVAVFPFIAGSTPRNGSVLAARLQGTPVITTHKLLRGYNASEHVFYVAPGDLDGMRHAIDCCRGKCPDGLRSVISWNEIATRHYYLYTQIFANRG